MARALKLTLIDTSPLISYLCNEPAAKPVKKLLNSRVAAVTQANLAEIYDVLTRNYRFSEVEIDSVIDSLTQPGYLTVMASTAATWKKAGLLRAKHYHHLKAAISLTDSFLLASAYPDRVVCSSDKDLLSVATKEGVDFLAVPNSKGKIPNV